MTGTCTVELRNAVAVPVTGALIGSVIETRTFTGVTFGTTATDAVFDGWTSLLSFSSYYMLSVACTRTSGAGLLKFEYLGTGYTTDLNYVPEYYGDYNNVGQFANVVLQSTGPSNLAIGIETVILGT